MTGLAIMLLDISVGETAVMLLHPLSPPLLKHLLKGERVQQNDGSRRLRRRPGWRRIRWSAGGERCTSMLHGHYGS